MEYLSIIPDCILPQSGLIGLAVSFSPFKLVVLIGWAYLCFYLVQHIQYHSLVPKEHRAVISIAALLMGPLIFIVLLLAAVMNRSGDDEDKKSILEILRDQLRNIGSSMSLPTFVNAKSYREIELFDSSGRNIREVFGKDKKKQQNNILEFTKQIIWNGLDQRASDILIDPRDENTYTVRYRVDGVLRVYDQLEADTCKAVVNCIKAVSSMDIAERRRPQDGSFTVKTVESTMSFRAASAGVLNGEKLSLRILGNEAENFSLDNIGYSSKQANIIKDAILKPSGLILMCGPTGSGKTTSIYGMLNEIDRETRNVITIEDPIEYILPNASQIEVNPKADITFAKALRSILRQDPDVICIGEIRDEETASIALRAAQTGHLVLASLHSNSNASALVRLFDLEVSPILMAAGINLIISQRLLRKLCKHCKQHAQPNSQQIMEFKKRKINYRNIYQAVGCEECHGTGYLGRTAVFDILGLTDELRDSIAQNDLLFSKLRQSGDKKGKSNLQKQALRKVATGITSLEELKRVIG